MAKKYKIIKLTSNIVVFILVIFSVIAIFLKLFNKDLLSDNIESWIALFGVLISGISYLTTTAKWYKVMIRKNKIKMTRFTFEIIIKLEQQNMIINENLFKIDGVKLVLLDDSNSANGKYNIKLLDSDQVDNDVYSFELITNDINTEIFLQPFKFPLIDLENVIDDINPLVDKLIKRLDKTDSEIIILTRLNFKNNQNPYLQDYMLSEIVSNDQISYLDIQLKNTNTRIHKNNITITTKSKTFSAVKNDIKKGILNI